MFIFVLWSEVIHKRVQTYQGVICGEICYGAVILNGVTHPVIMCCQATVIVNSTCIFLGGYDIVVMKCVKVIWCVVKFERRLLRKFMELKGQYDSCFFNLRVNSSEL